MRTIKFRAWKQSQKTMFYPKKTIHPIDLPQVMLEKENDILMQFTGLKDKNGKEIYEGDIVEYETFDTIIGVVEWCAGSYLLNGEEMYLDKDIYKIIGNIYENPELLEK